MVRDADGHWPIDFCYLVWAAFGSAHVTDRAFQAARELGPRSSRRHVAICECSGPRASSHHMVHFADARGAACSAADPDHLRNLSPVSAALEGCGVGVRTGTGIIEVSGIISISHPRGGGRARGPCTRPRPPREARRDGTSPQKRSVGERCSTVHLCFFALPCSLGNHRANYLLCVGLNALLQGTSPTFTLIC